MKIQHLALLELLVLGLFLLACKNEYHPPFDPGDWRKSAAFGGMPRAGAVSFSIENSAFVGLGFDGSQYYNDWYIYKGNENYWQRIDSFPGLPREQAIAFSIYGKGYVG